MSACDHSFGMWFSTDGPMGEFSHRRCFRCRKEETKRWVKYEYREEVPPGILEEQERVEARIMKQNADRYPQSRSVTT